MLRQSTKEALENHPD